MFRFLTSVLGFRSKATPRKRPIPTKARKHFQPSFENLEERAVPAASLVRDINVGPPSSSPTELVNVNLRPNRPGTLFFVADNGINGPELWKTVAPGVTRLVKDIYPGPTGSAPQYLTSVPLNANAPLNANPTRSIVYFTADDGLHGRELWRSDGTERGTRMVRDINIGLDSSDPSELTVFKNRLWFAADDGVAHGRELWRTNGPSNTDAVLMNDINPGTADSSPTYLTVVRTQQQGQKPQDRFLYFRAESVLKGAELWHTNGSRNVFFDDIFLGANSSSPFNLTSVIGGGGSATLFFGARDQIHGAEPWAVRVGLNSTQPTPAKFVKDINPGLDDSLLETRTTLITAFKNRLFFSATDGIFHGRELWQSNGTAAGTFLVRDINPGGADSNPTMQEHPLPERRALIIRGPNAEKRTSADRVLYFGADNIFTGGELWRTAGPLASTALVKDINVGPGSALAGNTLIGVVIRNQVYFVAEDGFATGRELWRLTGGATPALLDDIFSGPSPSNPASFEPSKNGLALFFAADNGLVGRELWALRTSRRAGARNP